MLAPACYPPQAFRILPAAFSVEGGELTPTLKKRRSVVAERYAEEIASFYGGPGATKAS